MEVHHHPEVGKKNFKEYLLESLMIFVAVTMGFFAESIRESINKNEKEDGYIVSLINDLKQDTAQMSSTIFENKEKMKGLDTVLFLASRDMTDPADRKSLYRLFGKYISVYSGFSSNDATMLQLKNSGGLQYIRHKHIADSIAAYDGRMTNILAAETLYTKSINDAVDGGGELLLFTNKTDTSGPNGKSHPEKQFPLINYDLQRRQIFFNKVYLEQGWTENYIGSLNHELPYAARLIGLLKKEYEIE